MTVSAAPQRAAMVKARSAFLAASFLAASLLVAGLLTACTATAASTPVIEVDADVALADQPIVIRVSGLAPSEEVEIAAEAVDYLEETWRSQATFVADDAGVVDLTRDAPIAGSYEGVDGMGLFWSMNMVNKPDEESFYYPLFPELAHEYQVRLIVSAQGGSSERVLRRVWMGEGVTHRSLDVGADGVTGDLYMPPDADGADKAGVLLIGGSGGGPGPKFEAALLASRGYPALAVSYFGMPGLPDELRDIPLEYFAKAAELLPAPVHVIGYSRGSEPAQLLAALFPDLVRSAVLYVPIDRVYPSYPNVIGNAWTYQGSPQLEIPYDRIDVPVLALTGAMDLLWPSAEAVRSIGRQTGGRALIYERAGHGMAGLPYLAATTTVTHAVSGQVLLFGGTREGDAAARHQGWREVLAFLESAQA